MGFLKSILYYCSLGLEWAVYVLRYWFLHWFGSQKNIRGVRVILLRSGSVLLVRHWFSPGIWTLPGGGISNGETPTEAAIREIREEVGYNIKSFGGEVGIYQGRMGRKDSAIVLFTQDFEGSLKILPDKEVIERSFFDLTHLPATISPANRRRIEAYMKGVRGERGFW